jgi:hypothetical protein
MSLKKYFFLNPKFWQATLFIWGSSICRIQDGEKSLRIGAILGKNLEESPFNISVFLNRFVTPKSDYFLIKSNAKNKK